MTTKEYIKEKEVASITGLALSTIRNDRVTQRRIPFYKIGTSVRYERSEILAFMESCKVKSDVDTEGERK